MSQILPPDVADSPMRDIRDGACLTNLPRQSGPDGAVVCVTITKHYENGTSKTTVLYSREEK